MRGRLQRDVKRSLRPDRPNLLVQEVSRLFSIQREIVVPKDFGEHNPQFSICKISSNAVPDTDRPRLERGIVVIWEHPIAFLKMALWDKFVRPSEIVVGEVGA